MGNNTGYACCKHCGAEYRLLTIFNRDMQGLCKAWKERHEHGCVKRTPAQRRKWAQRYAGKDRFDSALTVDLAHDGFKESAAHPDAAASGPKVGDRVFWSFEPRGGYEYVIPVAGIVRNVTPTRVTIEVAREVRGEWVREKKSVKPEKLKPRASLFAALGETK